MADDVARPGEDPRKVAAERLQRGAARRAAEAASEAGRSRPEAYMRGLMSDAERERASRMPGPKGRELAAQGAREVATRGSRELVTRGPRDLATITGGARSIPGAGALAGRVAGVAGGIALDSTPTADATMSGNPLEAQRSMIDAAARDRARIMMRDEQLRQGEERLRRDAGLDQELTRMRSGAGRTTPSNERDLADMGYSSGRATPSNERDLADMGRTARAANRPAAPRSRFRGASEADALNEREITRILNERSAEKAGRGENAFKKGGAIKRMAKGGAVKMAKGGAAKAPKCMSRGGGIESRGKTRGKFV